MSILSWYHAITRMFDQDRATEPPLETRPSLPLFDTEGWATDPRVVRIQSRPSWYYSKAKLFTADGLPDGIVVHHTATAGGTARGMAIRRRDHDRGEFRDPKTSAMPGSWHFTVPRIGEQIIQQASILRGTFHAGGPTARKTAVGWANRTCVGIELEGFGLDFPDHQIKLACLLWRWIVQHCGIEREHAMIPHSWIDPTRKRDPGELFMSKYAPRVLDFAFGADE